MSLASDEKGYEQVQFEVSDEVRQLLESRHILDDEIRMVIRNAETNGEKLYDPQTNKFLAKLRIGNATFYVEYSVTEEGSYVVHTAYSHRSELVEGT